MEDWVNNSFCIHTIEYCIYIKVILIQDSLKREKNVFIAECEIFSFNFMHRKKIEKIYTLNVEKNDYLKMIGLLKTFF